MEESMIYSIACTRNAELDITSQNLEHYFKRAGINHSWLVAEKSIFDAYANEIEQISPRDQDIVIMCHEDIEIWDDPQELKLQLDHCLDSHAGFIGVAGTTNLNRDAVWWDINQRKKGELRGFVWQGKDRSTFYPNYFGAPGRVTALDGCFLAASGKTLKSMNLRKPGHFTHSWDFYDLHYTLQAHKKGLENYVVPIHILHNSPGEMIAERGWAENRKGFLRVEDLPIKC